MVFGTARIVGTVHGGIRNAKFNWRCPFCDRHTTVNESQYQGHTLDVELVTEPTPVSLSVGFIACANPACRQLYIEAHLCKMFRQGGAKPLYHSVIEGWTLRPRGQFKPFPDYVPAAILQDYNEACSIVELSPKASATLSRRCLQGMIRNFWGITKNRLVDEINALEEKVDAGVWAAVDAVRRIGNIGAHMEKDINTIVDVDPQEAKLLVKLLEELITEWYVRREEKKQLLARVTEVAKEKREPKEPELPEPEPEELPEIVQPPVDDAPGE